MSEITMDLRLVFKIPDSELTINGLIQGKKKSCPEIHRTILSTLFNEADMIRPRTYYV